MTSFHVSSASTGILFIGGMVLLFLPDVVLPLFSPGYPTSAAWLGQLASGAWLGVAALNWLNRSAVLGGIYGRPVVFANIMLYFVGGLSLLRAAERAGFPPALSVLATVALVFAAVYGWLLFRGPLPKDLPSRSSV